MRSTRAAALWLTLAVSPAFAADRAEQVVAPYYPTPMDAAARMLELAELKPGETHYDLGSGDGRLVLLAARNFGAYAVGYEIDPKLVKSSRRRIEEWGVVGKAEIRDENLFEADLTKVDVVTVYLLPHALGALRPLLEKQLKRGARVVSHDFPIPGWEPDEKTVLKEETETEPITHTLYLYRR